MKSINNILVTGANGFVGNALVKQLANEPLFNAVVAATRRSNLSWPEGVRSVQVGDLLSSTDWSASLQGVVAVVHCAARVHVMRDDASDPMQVYRAVNVDGTLNLARQAARAGVVRFVFVSSIKVNGESTPQGRAFNADDEPAPVDAYGVSKWEAEQGLWEIAAQTGMELVIVRPPLVYGPGVKANFASMMRWVSRGIPLPLGRIHNARSMVALDNLVDLLVTCLKHSAAVGQTFLVSDSEDVSTTDLMHRTARAMDKRVLLLPVPASWIEFAAALIGKRAMAQRLCGSLQINIEKTRNLLSWEPPLTLDQGLKKVFEGTKS